MLVKSPAPCTRLSYPHDHDRSSDLPLFRGEIIDPPWDGPDWDDPDRWEVGPAIPADAILFPPELEDDEERAAFVHPAAVERAAAEARVRRQRKAGAR